MLDQHDHQTRVTVEPPPWIAGLPTDHRGFPVPAEAGWTDDNKPVIAQVGVERKVALLRACAVCGFHLADDMPIYRAFGQADAATIRLHERESSQDLAGPLHKSCVLYSAMVCPYLKQRTARLGKASTIQPGAPRGTKAAVMGFARMSLLVFAGRHMFLGPNSPPPYVGYLELVDDIKYRDGHELADLYAEAVEADTAHIHVTAERSYWTNDDMKTLERTLHRLCDPLSTRKADYPLMIGEARYAGFIV